MRSVEAQARGVLATLRSGHPTARALAISDSRAFVRSMFLASAVRSGLLRALAFPRSLAELAAQAQCARLERLEAWLEVGVELGELRREGDRYLARGRRARALAAGDPVLEAHYRSILDYQAGPYEELEARLRDAPGAGRDDLERHADVIARVSLAAAPFVVPYLDAVVAEVRPARALDVGSGTGIYVRALLEADPGLHVEGVDLASDVVADARAGLAAAGLADRAELHVADVRTWTPPAGRPRFELITLLNAVYYFPREDRPALYGRLGSLLTDGGELVVVTMSRAGSIASAHLHFMLSCEAGAASLPEASELVLDLGRAGYGVVEERTLVPTEPFVAIRARRN
jgi:SAM-dependent methyltransferase